MPVSTRYSGSIFSSANTTVREAARPAALLGAVLCAALCTGVLTGCAADPLTTTANSGASEAGYIEGDGATTSFAPEKRGEPVEFSGAADTGAMVTAADYRGSVTVINFWYAGCAPCRAEISDLVAAEHEFASQQVKFLGVNTRDQLAQAQQFAREFSVPYPSIMDAAQNREVQAAFAGAVPLNAVPTTLILDREGRVAHRVVGQIASASQLQTLIKETLAEG